MRATSHGACAKGACALRMCATTHGISFAGASHVHAHVQLRMCNPHVHVQLRMCMCNFA